jgi:hypothetical protein
VSINNGGEDPKFADDKNVWQRLWADDEQHWYFHNPETGESVWEGDQEEEETQVQ